MVPQCVHLATVLSEMFLTSGVPEALVMLYMSPNKQRTNVSVKHFVCVCKDGLLSPVYQEMLAPVVLHFCVLLRQVLVTHVDDDLYVFFWTTLGSMLSDYAWFSTSTSKIALYDIFPFVDELAYKLSNDLVESVNSVIGPSETDVRDFKAFVWFLLAVLGAEEIFWTSLKPNKVAFCYLIVNYVKKGDKDYKWILDRKDMTDFKSRRHLAIMLLHEVTNDYNNLHEMFINRSNLLAESFESITGAEIAALHGPMHIGFINEEATGHGVLREWFSLVCEAIFNPQNALFVACPTDRRRFFPNPCKLHFSISAYIYFSLYCSMFFHVFVKEYDQIYNDICPGNI
nr:E3 ubiquitin-protein ligase UPL5-like [Tanacetum cinerariifolium]